MAMLQLRQVSFTYPGAAAPAVRQVSFSVEKGELVCLCGATGSGKTTLLRLIKRELMPRGQLEGDILLNGVPMGELPPRTAAFSVGYVLQRPDEQIVTDKVWHELAFGLENMGLPQNEIARRVAETAAYFGMEGWFEKPVSQLSGGQKQLLNLAAVMAMQPELLILDEPTAQLDPIAAADFIATVHRLNRELGLTVLVIEHRLEELMPLCDKLLALEDGRLLVFAPPGQAAAALRQSERLLPGLPAAARLFHALGETGECPLSIRQGRQLVEGLLRNAAPTGAAASGAMHAAAPAQKTAAPRSPAAAPALDMQKVFFRYERSGQDVLRGASLTVQQGEAVCLLGGNGSGKSTLLRLAAGLDRAQHGRVKVFGQPIAAYRNQSLYRSCVALLPQDVQTVFLADTVREELAGTDLSSLPFDPAPLLDRHPYDLSGGEQQLVALARVLAQQPRLLLLDEPAKGLDGYARQQFLQVLKSLRAAGVSLLIVTHDVEFAAQCADRCVLLFRGEAAAEGASRSFFRENLFYTTAISRMTRGLLPEAVTVEDAASLLDGRKATPQAATDPRQPPQEPPAPRQPAPAKEAAV